jgi:ATP-dependent helicase/nuclease subunit A
MSDPVKAPHELVLASAGSGKTYRVTTRLIQLLALGEEPEHLLASSFTRKAAGEILHRTLKRLAEGASTDAAARELAIAVTGLEAGDATRESGSAAPPVIGGRIADAAFWGEILERVVQKLHRLNIGTLDSYFVRAASSFEQELGLPPGWRIADEPEVRRLRSEVLQEVIETMDRTELLTLLRLVNKRGAERSVHDELLKKLDVLLTLDAQVDPGVPNAWHALRAYGPGGERPLSASEREALAARIEAIPIPTVKAGTPNRNWEKALRALPRCIRAGDWLAAIGSPLCRKWMAGEDRYDQRQIDCVEEIEEVVDACRTALRARYADQIESLGHLTRRLADALERRRSAAGAFTFEDITRLVGADPLVERSDFYYRLDAKARHILLDEFQDTSFAQWEAVKPLLDEAASDESRLAVVVADPKQSIYGWRGASPAIVREGAGPLLQDSATLAVSYRSSEVVLDFVNQVLGRIDELPDLGDVSRAAAEWVVDFHRHVPHRKKPGYVRVETGPEEEKGNLALCRRAAERVAELHRAAPGRSIGVLVRKNATVARIILQLRELGVFASEEGGNPLTDSGGCEAVLAALRLADHPGDTIARYHVARSALGPLIGLTEPISDDAARALALRIRRELVEEGYGAWLSRLVHRMAPGCDERELRRLLQLVETGFRYDGSASLRPMDFVRLVEARRVEDPAVASVRVMTVHQSKGLEFDVVVLPELDDPILRRGRGGIAFPYRPSAVSRVTEIHPFVPKEVRILFPEVERACEQAVRAEARDGLSALYVALTRARYAIHILLAPERKGLTSAHIIRSAIGAPESNPADSVLFDTGDPQWHGSLSAEEAVQPPTAPEAAAPAPSIRLRPGERSRHLPRRSPSQMEGEALVDPRVLLKLEHGDAMRRGTIVHAWFEGIRWLEDPLPDRDSLNAVARLHQPEIGGEALDALHRDFSRWLGMPEIAGALSSARYELASAEVRAEHRFIQREAGLLVEGSVDRLVLIRENGKITRAEIFDFKTDRIGGDDVVLEERIGHYRPQLEAYARAIRASYRLDANAVGAYLVMLDAARVVPVLEADGRPSAPMPGAGAVA